MSWYNKIVWSEGLFLQPQHFQQHDRYVENLVSSRCGNLRPFGWGFTEIEIDKNLLRLGKLGLSLCSGVFADGTSFSIPSQGELPAPLTLDETYHNQIVFLAIPLERPGLTETDISRSNGELARFCGKEFEAADTTSGHEHSPATVLVAQPKLRLLSESDERAQFTCLPIASVVELSADKGGIIDDSFIAPCLHCNASPYIRKFLDELYGQLKQRGEVLASRMTEAGRGGVAEVADFLMLQLVNRFEPLIAHLAKVGELHPEALYRVAIQLAGELATFTRAEKRPTAFPVYQHDNLKSTLLPVVEELRRALSMVLEQNAIAIAIEERDYGVRVAILPDAELLKKAQFVLAVNADVRPDVLQTHFPAQVKIGPVEHIRQLVNSGLPGIELQLLPVAPRQIPYHAGYTYFELDSTSRFWDALSQSSAFAFHVAGEFPGLKLEFWAIRP